MRKLLLRTVGTIATALLLTTAVTSAAASAAPPRGNITITIELIQPGPDAVVPDPGSALPNSIGYDANLWAVVWKCSYAGWAKISVNWRCELRDMWTNATLSTKTGSFSSGSANPGPWYYFAANSGYCVYAEAHYASYPTQTDHNLLCQY